MFIFVPPETTWTRWWGPLSKMTVCREDLLLGKLQITDSVQCIGADLCCWESVHADRDTKTEQSRKKSHLDGRIQATLFEPGRRNASLRTPERKQEKDRKQVEDSVLTELQEADTRRIRVAVEVASSWREHSQEYPRIVLPLHIAIKMRCGHVMGEVPSLRLPTSCCHGSVHTGKQSCGTDTPYILIRSAHSA